MSTVAMNLPDKKKQAPLTYFLWFVFALFISILIVCYAITKRTNPVELDEHGKPVASSPVHDHAGH